MDYVGGVVSKLKLPDMIFSCESWLCSMGFLAKVLSKIPSFTLAVSFQEWILSWKLPCIAIVFTQRKLSKNHLPKSPSPQKDGRLVFQWENKQKPHPPRSPNDFTPGHLISNSISPTWGDLKTGDFPGKNWMSTDTPYKAQHAGGMSPPKWYWHCSSSMIHPNLVLCRPVLFSLIAEHKIETRSLVTPRAPVEQLWHVVTLGPTCAEVDVTWAAWITSFRGIQVALQNIWWCPSTTMPAIPKTLDAK